MNPKSVENTYVLFKDLRTMRKTYAPAYKYRGHVFVAKVTRYKIATLALSHSREFLEKWRARYQAREEKASHEKRIDAMHEMDAQLAVAKVWGQS